MAYQWGVTVQWVVWGVTLNELFRVGDREMDKFRLKWSYSTVHYITDGVERFMHSDGSIYSCCEYFPTEEQAQAVLDKFQPKHVWVHGDVFRKNTTGTPMIYVYTSVDGPMLYSLRPINDQYPTAAAFDVNSHLDTATFLFNIKDKL